MKLFDIIEVFIAGDWGEETYSKETPYAVTCVRGADIIPISEYDFSAIPVRYINQQAYAKKCLQVGDIIIEKSGGSPTQSTGRVSLVSQELLDHAGAVICSNFCTAFRVKKGWNPLYVYYYLQFIYNLGAFFNFEGKTSGIKNLQLDAAFAAIPTEDISESIQNNIVVILQGLEKKIAINRQINQNLEAMAKQLYDYWFVQFDFPNEEGKPYKSNGGEMVWNEVLKREIPKDWEVLSFGDLFNIGNGKNIPNSSGTIPAYGGNGIIKYVDKSNYDSCFIVGRVGANCGSLHYSPTKCWVSDNAISVVPKNLNEIAYLLFSLKLYDLSKNKGGSSQPLVTHKGLECLAFPYSVKFVSKFCNIANKLLNLYFENINSLLSLTKQRNELLPLLMNGQVSVNSDLSAH